MERRFQTQEDPTTDVTMRTGAQKRHVKHEELASISKAFRQFDMQAPRPSVSQWRGFQDGLAQKIAKDSQQRGFMRFARSIRMVYATTDSAFVRFAIVFIGLIALGAIAFAVWFAAMFALEGAVPVTSQIPGGAQRAIAAAVVVVPTHGEHAPFGQSAG